MVGTVEKHATPVCAGKLWPMTVEAYHVLGEAGVIPENTELLYGLVYTKMPKSPIHTFFLYRFLHLLQRFPLLGLWIRSEQPLTFADSEPEPDISVVRGAFEDFLDGHPTSAEIVIEVCVSSEDYDRSKLRAYATAQVKECWLVLVSDERVEVMSEPREGVYTAAQTFDKDDVVLSRAVPAIRMNLNEVFHR